MRISRVGRRSGRTWDACTLTEPSWLQVCLMPGKTRVFGWTGWSTRCRAWSLIYGEHHLDWFLVWTVLPLREYCSTSTLPSRHRDLNDFLGLLMVTMRYEDFAYDRRELAP